MRIRTLLGACALTSGLAPRPLHAEEESLQIELYGCTFVDVSEVRRVVRTELGDGFSRLGAESRLEAQCAGDRVSIEVTDSKNSEPLTRSFALGEQDAGVSRLIGIATAELILEREELEPQRRKVPSSETRPVRANPAPSRGGFEDADRLGNLRERDLHLEDHLRIVGLASRRALFAYGGALFGGALRLEAEPLPHLSWATDVSFERGDFSAGTARFQVETWTLGAHLFFAQEVAPFLLRAGGGLRAGFASSTPLADEERDTGVLASWGWPLVALNVSVRIGRGLVLELSSEASYVVLPVSRGGRALRGMWLGNQLGLGYVF